MLFMLIFMAVGGFLSAIMGQQGNSEATAATYWGLGTAVSGILTIITLIMTFVYAVKFVYNAWLTVASREDSVSAGWRIGLLFIPYFNVIWTFFVFWEFAKRANAALERFGEPKMMSSGAAFAYCLISVFSLFAGFFMGFSNLTIFESPTGLVSASVVILLNSILSLVALGLLLVWVVQTRAAAVKVAELKSEYASTHGAM